MRALPITGEYPPNWKEISDATWAAAGHRCLRCHHPYKKGEHGTGQWTRCDDECRHGGPYGLLQDGLLPQPFASPLTAAQLVAASWPVCAEWRIGTVHHFDGNKANVAWWNLLALCQRCHLKTQARVDPEVPYILEHSDWIKPYVAGFYAKKYLGKDLTREETMASLQNLLNLERIA